MFANALQDRYALKKVNNSASLGVGVLGSVSMPIGSTDDSMVKVASETVSSPQFYDRFFTLVEAFLPKPKEVEKAVHAPEAPKPDLGVPEAVPAKDAAAPVIEPPAPAVEPVSEPVVPPADVEPISPVEVQAAPAAAVPEIKPATEQPEPAKAVAPQGESAITPVPVAVEPSPPQ